MRGCRARRRRIRAGTRTGPGPGGRCGRSRRSWRTLGIRGGRCGTGSRPQGCWSTRPIPGWGISRCSGGTCPRVGHLPAARRMRRWSARLTSSPPRTRPRRADRQGPRCAGTCWPGSALRPVRAAAGILLVLRQARLPVPARPLQRQPSRPGPAQEHLRARGPDPAAPGRHRILLTGDSSESEGGEPGPAPTRPGLAPRPDRPPARRGRSR